MIRYLILPLCVLSLLLPAAGAEKQDAAKPVGVLVVAQGAGFQHAVVKRRKGKLSHFERMMTGLGESSGLFTAHCTQDVARDFTKEKLDACRVVVFYTTGDLPIPKETLDYFLGDWLKQPGRGFIGVHAATDTYKKHKPFYEMIGGTFAGHPWGARETVAVAVHDPQHPVCKPFGDGFSIKDEIYRFGNWKPENVRVLMSLDMAKTKHKEPYHVPIAWVRDYGRGKVVFMSLGHNRSVLNDEKYQQSLLGGVRWILGLEKGDATPNPDLSAAEEKKAAAAKKAAQPANK